MDGITKRGDSPTSGGNGEHRGNNKKGKAQMGTVARNGDVEMHGKLFGSLSSEIVILTAPQV